MPPLLFLVVLGACAGPGAVSADRFYETACIERQGLQPGTAAFAACVARKRRDVEETQAAADRIDP